MTFAEEDDVEVDYVVKGTIQDEEEEERTMDETTKLLDTADDVSKRVNPNNVKYYEIFFVVLPVFMGYAALFSQQDQVLYAVYGAGASEPTVFSFGISMLYMGNLVFRLGHNVLFAFCGPRYRVIISMTSMTLSMLTICTIFWGLPHVGLVYVGYGLGGLAIGTFEANVLSMVTVLGKDTKLWAIVAIPVGINIVNIGAYALLEVWPWLYDNPWAIQFTCAVSCMCGLAVLFIRIWRICAALRPAMTLKEFVYAFKAYKQWMWAIRWHSLALFFDMFCVSLFSPGVILYIYSGSCVPYSVLGFDMSRDWFVCLYNTFFFAGDTSSRKIFYLVRIINPMFFLILSVIGVVCGLSDITLIVPMCAFLVAFANGSIYTQANRLIDHEVDDQYNLIALSFWLFLGDCGSVLGSNTTPFLTNLFESVYGTYTC
eukprot:CAMPEP_0114626266 /NCGR_PEP_ID=MMETSP0168-20121206/11691_1 /TAXON_ID=95228 ORGANISM="Vannella sp., Strain DIVA3 517/6/12" /NCGR_SAMPLE_ID=MMETSP0168 /ASSEMBLY_ACC=CAM_ASM_000044 /LENGTH=427 /DNA_ID=CAMNT_0001837561 /DNA_START=10 /DNA_END=1290 /DNA_ORIENTATION=-